MVIAVDAHAVGRKQTGNETYVRNLFREFARADVDADFIAYISARGAETLIPSAFRYRWISENPFVRLGYDLSQRLRHDRPALVHVQYTSPVACPVPAVVTVHDVSYLEHPGYFSSFRRNQLRWSVARTVRRAARIVTPSEFSRDRVSRAYGIDPERITVIHNGVDPRFRPMARDAAFASLRARLSLNAPFVLTVGDLQARKNQVGLVRAFVQLVRNVPSLPHHLVLAGKENWHGCEVREAAAQSGCADRIRFTGFVSDDDLHRLYAACDAFVFPSFYEGFGLPVLEAMACGRAVACSDQSALPEVADSAALLFDPRSIDDMARAMRDLLVDAELRTRMERLGQARASQFSWQRAAAETLAVYRQVAGRRAAARAGVTA
jgi:glycosyltransferase involved in cell wall biosynthesis